MIYMACGYSGTGSSALVHLLSEYSNCTFGKRIPYEHILFYIPNGLFDLEDRLLLNNSIHGSDGALSEFRSAMKRLNDNDFGWFGSLKKLYGSKFMNIVDEFIDELVDYKIPGYWSHDIELVKSPVELVKQTAHKFCNHKIYHYGYKTTQTGDGYILYSFVTPERFYSTAKKFVSAYISMVSDNSEKCFVCDQIFQPHHLKRMNNYFMDGEAKAIVVDRDARDMFILTKYVWPYMGMPVAFPKNAKEFASFYKILINSANISNSNSIMKIHFEDLVYRYDDTIAKIQDFIGKEAGIHEKIKKMFIPEHSIKNTQNFRICKKWINEVKIIEDIVPELIYNFPYKITPKISETTDP